MALPSTFKSSLLEDTVKARFPTISRFEIDWMSESVQPVIYDDIGIKYYEYPPVAKWQIGNVRFKYVAKPTFKKTSGLWWLPKSGSVRADYNDDVDNLFQVIQWTVEGKTTEEINDLLGNAKIDKY